MVMQIKLLSLLFVNFCYCWLGEQSPCWVRIPTQIDLSLKRPGDFTALNIQRLPYFQRDLEDRLGEKPIHKKLHECIKTIIISLNLLKQGQS